MLRCCGPRCSTPTPTSVTTGLSTSRWRWSPALSSPQVRATPGSVSAPPLPPRRPGPARMAPRTTQTAPRTAHGISAAARHVHCVRHPPRSQSRCAPVCCPQITGCTCGTFSSRRVTVAATPRSLAIGRACEAWRRCCVEVADVFSLVARLNPETQASRAWFAWSRSSSSKYYIPRAPSRSLFDRMGGRCVEYTTRREQNTE